MFESRPGMAVSCCQNSFDVAVGRCDSRIAAPGADFPHGRADCAGRVEHAVTWPVRAERIPARVRNSSSGAHNEWPTARKPACPGARLQPALPITKLPDCGGLDALPAKPVRGALVRGILPAARDSGLAR